MAGTPKDSSHRARPSVGCHQPPCAWVRIWAAVDCRVSNRSRRDMDDSWRDPPRRGDHTRSAAPPELPRRGGAPKARPRLAWVRSVQRRRRRVDYFPDRGSFARMGRPVARLASVARIVRENCVRTSVCVDGSGGAPPPETIVGMSGRRGTPDPTGGHLSSLLSPPAKCTIWVQVSTRETSYGPRQ